VFGGIVISTEQVLTRMANLVRAAGVMPEIELFDSGDARSARAFWTAQASIPS
jgi:uncharacterized protein (DUF849 family)